MRYAELDGLRGAFLVSMMAGHMTMTGEMNTPISGMLVVKNYSFTDAASGFVFMSGLIVALVYGRKYQKGANLTAPLLRRAREIWFYHVGTIAFTTALAMSFYLQGETHWLFNREPLHFGLYSAALLTGGWVLDILPMYIFFILLTPLILRAVMSGHALAVGLTSTLLWALGQTGIHAAASTKLTSMLNPGTFEIGLWFNLLGWQAIYTFGVLIGGLVAQKKIQPASLLSKAGWPAAVCAAFFLLSLALAFYANTKPNLAFSQDLISAGSKQHQAPLSLASFAAAAVCIAYALAVGKSHRNTLVRLPSLAVNSVVNLRPLVFLGQHSLQVFSAHIAFVYLFHTFEWSKGSNTFWSETWVVAGILFLFLPAAAHHAYRSWKASSRVTAQR